MATPLWLDGPLKGEAHHVTEDQIEQGMYRAGSQIYTFTVVGLIQREIVVASVANGIPSPELLFSALLTPEAQRAAR